MKKFLLTLILAISFFGTSFADGVDGAYESYWGPIEEIMYNYDYNICVTGFLYVDDVMVELDADDDWRAWELAFFADAECTDLRGHDFLDYPENGGDFVHPALNALTMYVNASACATTQFFVKVYNHKTQMFYDAVLNREVWGQHEDWTTGDVANDYWEYYNTGEYEDAVNVYVTTPSMPTFTRTIQGYDGGEGGWYLIASPVDGVNPADVIDPEVEASMVDGIFDLYYFDQEQEKEWRNYKEYLAAGEPFTLDAGKGYLYAHNEDITLNITGNPVDITEVTLTKVDEKPWTGWNLVGNPLTTEAYINRAYYTMDNDEDLVPYDETRAIQSLEGVFVVANEDGETLTFTEEPSASGAKAAFNLSNGHGIVDRAIVRFDQGSQLPKMQLRNSTSLSFAQDNMEYAVVRSEGMGEMPVNFKAVNNGTYTLNFTNENVEFGYFHLIDNMTGADIDLLQTPNYSFDATTSDYTSRFRLVFATGNANNGSEFAFVSNGNIIVNGEGTLQVMDVTGRILSTEQINGVSTINVNAAAGVYVLQLTGNDVKTQKIVVK